MIILTTVRCPIKATKKKTTHTHAVFLQNFTLAERNEYMYNKLNMNEWRSHTLEHPYLFMRLDKLKNTLQKFCFYSFFSSFSWSILWSHRICYTRIY